MRIKYHTNIIAAVLLIGCNANENRDTPHQQIALPDAQVSESDSHPMLPWNNSVTYGVIEYNGRAYKTIFIDSQEWMAENLNYSGNGVDSIGHCYMDSKDSCSKYGRLYNWTEAMGIDKKFLEIRWGSNQIQQGICPEGWHIPSDVEWHQLSVKFDSMRVGNILKSIAGWNEGGNGSDSLGFRGLPAGLSAAFSAEFTGTMDGVYNEIGKIGLWWTSTEKNDKGAFYRALRMGSSDLNRFDLGKVYGYSVRCKRN